MSLKLLVFCGLLTLATLARAEAPALQIGHQGRLLDGQDAPVEGLHRLHFQLWSSPVPLPTETPLWEETYDVTLARGFYSQAIGAALTGKKTLPASVFAAGPVFLSIEIDAGGALSPRMVVGTVPRAAVAEVALVANDVKCAGCIDEDELSFNPSLVDGAVTRAKLAARAVGRDQLDLGAVGAEQLADGAVHTTQLADGAVTAAKLAGGAIGAGLLGDGAVTSAKLTDGSVTATKLATGAVGAAQLADGSVTSGKLTAGAVGAAQLADGSVTSGKLAAGAVGAAQLADGSVTLAKLDPAIQGHTAGGTGINADLLDGKHASDFLTATTKVAADSVGGLHLATGTTTDGSTVSLAGKGFTAPPQVFFGTTTSAVPIASQVTTSSFRVDLAGFANFRAWACSNDTMYLYNETGAVQQTFDPPDTNTSGVAYDSSDNTLWLVTQGTNHLNHVRTDGTQIGSSLTLASADSIA